MTDLREKPKGVILDMQTLGKAELPEQLRDLCDWEIYDVVSDDKAKEIVKDKEIAIKSVTETKD